MRVAKQSATEHLKRAAKLKRQRGRYRSVPGVHVGLRRRPRVAEEDLTDLAGVEPRHRRVIAQTTDLEGEALRSSSICKSSTSGGHWRSLGDRKSSRSSPS